MRNSYIWLENWVTAIISENALIWFLGHVQEYPTHLHVNPQWITILSLAIIVIQFLSHVHKILNHWHKNPTYWAPQKLCQNNKIPSVFSPFETFSLSNLLRDLPRQGRVWDLHSTTSNYFWEMRTNLTARIQILSCMALQLTAG